MNIKSLRTGILLTVLMCVVLAFSGCDDDEPTFNTTTAKPSVVFIGLTNSTTTIPSALIRYNASNVNSIVTTAIAITGLQTGESIIAIDYRPANKVLYGLSSASRLYSIALTTSAAPATLIGTGPIVPAIAGTIAAFDFNPVADRLRVVTSTGQNLRINPADATVIVDGALNGVANAVVTGVAYTNSVAGATETVLYDLDVASQKLYKQDANVGALTEVGPLGSLAIPLTNVNYLAAYNTNITTARNTAAGGFDISAAGIALATFSNNAAPAIPINGFATGNPLSAVSASTGTSTLFQINLTTGKATDLGIFPIPAAANYAAASSIIGIAIVP